MICKCHLRTATGFLLVLTILGMIYGLLMIVYGTWVIITQTSFINLTKIVTPPYDDLEEAFSKSSVLQQSYYVLVISGVIALFSYILGFWGTIQRKNIYMIAFIVILIVLIGLEAAAGMLTFLHNYQVKRYANEFLHETYKLYEYNNSMNINNTWNQMMYKLKCCGIYNHSDLLPLSGINGSLPSVCCNHDEYSTYSTLQCNSNSHNLFHEGCASQLKTWLCYHLITLSEIVLAMVILQIITIIAIFSFSYLLKQERSYKGQKFRPSLVSTLTTESGITNVE